MTIHKAGKIEKFFARIINKVAALLNKINVWLINRERRRAK